jgi:uncharacterized protein
MGSWNRGFASMDEAKKKLIASLGGKAAHEKGTAHQWTTETAKLAGRKGGLETARRRKAKKLEAEIEPATV